MTSGFDTRLGLVQISIYICIENVLETLEKRKLTVGTSGK